MNEQTLSRTKKLIFQLFDQLEKEELSVEEISKRAKLVSGILYLVFEIKDNKKANRLLSEYMEMSNNV